MTIENSVSNYFWCTFVDSIDVFDCRLPGELYKMLKVQNDTWWLTVCQLRCCLVTAILSSLPHNSSDPFVQIKCYPWFSFIDMLIVLLSFNGQFTWKQYTPMKSNLHIYLIANKLLFLSQCYNCITKPWTGEKSLRGDIVHPPHNLYNPHTNVL